MGLPLKKNQRAPQITPCECAKVEKTFPFSNEEVPLEIDSLKCTLHNCPRASDGGAPFRYFADEDHRPLLRKSAHVPRKF